MPCTSGTINYSYHGDAVYGSSVPAVYVSATDSLDPTLKSFDVDTVLIGYYTRSLYIKGFFPNVLTTTGDEIHQYSEIVNIDVYKYCDPAVIYTFTPDSSWTESFTIRVSPSTAISTGHTFGGYSISPITTGCSDVVSYTIQGDNTIGSGTPPPA